MSQTPPETTGRLTDLDATFVRHTGGGNFAEVQSITEANGVLFDCPECGRHSVLVWDRSIPAGIEPGPGRWTMSGTGLHDLTLNPSVDLSRSGVGCLWHGWVKDGGGVVNDSPNRPETTRPHFNSRPGDRNGRARLTARSVRMIRKAVRDGIEQKTLAEAYGVHPSAISLAVLGKTRRHV